MCRPFIREPMLVKKMQEGVATQASCISCNQCLVHTGVYDLPVRCYVKKRDGRS
jgi:2,4-dienoyl-CoA reductase-like NADH-dependent reductase (Old Yellow Enzyme family)